MFNRKQKKKKSTSKYSTFINDRDGISAKDYLLIISTAVFFGFVIVGLVLALASFSINENYMELLNLTAEPLMVIVGGIMGVQAVEVFANRKRNNVQADEEIVIEPIETYEENYENEDGNK